MGVDEGALRKKRRGPSKTPRDERQLKRARR